MLNSFLESYRDCARYAHAMVKAHRDPEKMERYPPDVEAEQLLHILRPSPKRLKLNSGRVVPLPIFSQDAMDHGI